MLFKNKSLKSKVLALSLVLIVSPGLSGLSTQLPGLAVTHSDGGDEESTEVEINKNSRSRLLEARNGWILSLPPSHILWSVYTKHAADAADDKEHHKALVLSEAALEHVRHLDEESHRKKKTMEMLHEHSKLNEIEVHAPTLKKVANTPYVREQPSYLKKAPPRNFSKPESYIDTIREADLLASEGEADKAEALYIKALSQLSRLKSTDGMIMVRLIDRVTRVFYRDGKYQQAEEIIREHLFRHDSMWERLGPADPDRLQIAFLLSDLGLVYCGMNRYYEAEAATVEALKIVKQFNYFF